MVKIVGKCNRKVPVIITPDLKSALEVLIVKANRETGSVCDENQYIFPVNDGKSTCSLRGNDVLHHVCAKVKLENAFAITSTNMRKYVATVSQSVDITETEMGWLARHMGHNIHIHKEFYGMQESTLEIAVVGNLLLAIEEGRALKFKGKNLSNIKIDSL